MENLIIVRGGGDIATGTIQKLYNCGYNVLVLESKAPTAIRRQVSLCEAIYEKTVTVENVTVEYAENIQQIKNILKRKNVPIVVDEKGEYIEKLKPDIVIDAILAKKNLGTKKDFAPLTIALGPGFEAQKDVHYVVETNRGHNLGRIINVGSATKNTGIPGDINGYTTQRVIYATHSGKIKHICKIGDIVSKGQVIAVIENENEKIDVLSTMDGLLRGLIRDNFNVKKGFKIADIDPRKSQLKNCFTISDKARCIAGSVLELVCKYYNENGCKNG